MRRAGVIYQQMVLGLSDLLSERTSLKNEYRMVRTTVRPEGNNPFKWAPPRRVALDLLKGRDDGFLSGPAAVRESFEDLKKHLLCLLAAMRASLAATLEALSPAAIEKRMKTPAFVIRGNRATAAWAEYERVFADFKQQADDNPDSQVNREFRAAYERQLRDLDDLSDK
jgi:type VI secretion system FHA domain protein